MEYADIFSTTLYWYAIVGFALLMGSVVVYGVALFIYWLLARLVMLISYLLRDVAGHGDVSLWRHHPSR